MKKLCKIFAAFALVFTLVACSSDATLEGKYYVTSMENYGVELDYDALIAQGITDDIYIEFTGDDTAVMGASGVTQEITLDTKAKTVSASGETVNYKVDGDDFIMYDDDVSITYTKEGSSKLNELRGE